MAGLGQPARKRVMLPLLVLECCWAGWDVCASRPVRVSIPASTSSLRRDTTACCRGKQARLVLVKTFLFATWYKQAM